MEAASRRSSVCGLKVRPSSATRLPRRRPRPLLQLADDAALLQVIDLDDGVQELEVVAGVAGELLERLHVLGKAGAAVADAGLQEVRPDAVVEPHAVGHGAHVGAHVLADVGDLVDERDLGGQERVGGVLDHLGGGHGGAHDGRLDAGVEALDRRRRRASRYAPITMRSGCRTSSMAAPSRRNSGLET